MNRFRQRKRRGNDRKEVIPIELEDLYNNVTKIEIKQKTCCLDCRGKGVERFKFYKRMFRLWRNWKSYENYATRTRYDTSNTKCMR